MKQKEALLQTWVVNLKNFSKWFVVDSSPWDLRDVLCKTSCIQFWPCLETGHWGSCNFRLTQHSCFYVTTSSLVFWRSFFKIIFVSLLLILSSPSRPLLSPLFSFTSIVSVRYFWVVGCLFVLFLTPRFTSELLICAVNNYRTNPANTSLLELLIS